MSESWIIAGQKWYLTDGDLEAVNLGGLWVLVVDRLPPFVPEPARLAAASTLRHEFKDDLLNEETAGRMWCRACELVGIPAESPAQPPPEFR